MLLEAAVEVKSGIRSANDCDFNWSMQHLDSKYREEDVADEAASEDLLFKYSEGVDVGPLAEGRFIAYDCRPF